MDYFQINYPSLIKTVRVLADEEVRMKRNWIFTKGNVIFNCFHGQSISFNNSIGADDCSSECDLDHISNWDFTIHNNDDEKILMTDIQLLTDYLKKMLAIIV